MQEFYFWGKGIFNLESSQIINQVWGVGEEQFLKMKKKKIFALHAFSFLKQNKEAMELRK